MEAIRIFLSFVTYMNFIVFQLDVKSSFLNGFDLKGYSISSYAGCNMDKKSTSGACQILGGKLICWSAKKQQSMAISLVEAEYVAAAGFCASILWMKSRLSGYDIHYKMVPIFGDNTSAISISKNLVLYSRTKHIDIRYHFIRDHILKKDIELHFIPTEYQLADIFTKPLDEPTFTRMKAEEFCCTAIAYDPKPSTDDFEVHPLKEYLIKFSVMNGKKPLTLDFKTFTESTGLDYAKDTYVSHPSIEKVKAELTKIVGNQILLDRTAVLKTVFPVALRILFTFVVQVLSGNSSYIELVNSIQKLFACCLLTGTKVDIGDIIYGDLIITLTNKSRQRYVFYLRFVSCTLAVLVGPDYTHMYSKDPSKVTPIELTDLMVAGPEALRSLPQKRKKPKSKKTPTETKPANKGLHSTIFDEGAAKTTSLPEGPRGDKDSEGLKPPGDMEPHTNPIVDPSLTNAKYLAYQTQSARLKYLSLTKNKGKTSSEVEPDIKALELKTFANIQELLLSDDEMVQERDDEEVFAAEENMDEDT
ncbi:hypothetical protein Tco_0680410 [Tanacetum coccineum]|uniref:Retrovirus-related Pol polyprotein from transposon TNT 1-94 n=1 Tax=Tanacetum coccineum TaxID=301880 RepID=A0ABQ4XLC6_9ASTR